MASWQPESWNDRLRWARATARARRSSTVAACRSTRLRSRAVSENSDATATAVPRVRATTASRPSAASRTVTGVRGRGRGCVGWARGAPPPGRPGVRAASVGRGAGFGAAVAPMRVRRSAPPRADADPQGDDSRARHLGPHAGGDAPRFCAHDGAGRRVAVRRLRPGGVGAARGERAAAADRGRAGAAAQRRGRGRPRRGARGVPAAVAAADAARAGERAALPGVPDASSRRSRCARRS